MRRTYYITTTNYNCPVCGEKLKSSNDAWTGIVAILCIVLIIFVLPYALSWGLVDCVLKLEIPYACREYKYIVCPKCGTKVRMTDARQRCYDELTVLEQWQFDHRGLKGMAIACGGSTLLGFGFSFYLIDPTEICQILGAVFLSLCLISFLLFIVIVVYWKKQCGELERTYQSKNGTQTAKNAQKETGEQRKAEERYENRKREYEARKRREAEEAQKQKTEQDTATCKELLDQCGMQFFIEYYPQLKRLPIPDITVSDHYFPERQTRLTAAKKIIDAGLSECALHYIIETFGDVFSEEIIERAKNLLNEIENKNGEIK